MKHITKAVLLALVTAGALNVSVASACDKNGKGQHANEWMVRYTDTSGYTVQDLTFTSTAKSIPSSQADCDKEPLGTVYHLGTDQNGKDRNAIFTEGRKSDSGVAGWFTHKLDNDKSKNTFNVAPTSLNFAFAGDMDITISGNGVPSSQRYVLKDMVIAQGNTGGDNNWWLGGEHCKNVGGSRIQCTATPPGDAVPGVRNLLITFHRGGGRDSPGLNIFEIMELAQAAPNP